MVFPRSSGAVRDAREISAGGSTPGEPIRVTVPLLDHEVGGLPEIPAWCRAAQEDPRFEVRSLGSHQQMLMESDVLYVYFPEWLLRGSGPIDGLRLRYVRLLSSLTVAKRRGMRIVWHANNLIPHETDRAGLTDRFLERFSGMTDALVASSQTSVDQFIQQYPRLRRSEQWIIPMGDYRPFYSAGDNREAARLRLGIPAECRLIVSLGMIRPYKNHLGLIRAMSGVADPDARLVIAGRCSDDDLLAKIRYAAAADSRVTVEPGFLANDELVRWTAASDVAVLATGRTIKSGSALLALSFDRPVIVPELGEFVDWEDQIGTEWVTTYRGGIRSSAIRSALEKLPTPAHAPLRPYFDWDRASRQLADCFAHVATRRRPAR